MSLSGYGSRYLIHKDFLKLSKELEIINMGGGFDEQWLEFLEKAKIFFPICRIIMPESYLKLITKIHRDPSNPYYGKGTYYLPSRYENIHYLKSNFKYFGWNKNLFHILDKQKPNVKRYIRNPKRTKFYKWNSYEKFMGKFYGIEDFESVAEHYYSYWQVYHFYEITKACTLNYMVNVFDKEIRSSICKRILPQQKIFMRSLLLNYDNLKGDFLGQAKNFEFLSFYVQTLLKYDVLVSRSKNYEKDRFGYLNEKSTFLYNQNRIKLAKLTVKKYDLKNSQVLDFLKFLCIKFDEYERAKMDQLNKFLKKDIYNLILLIGDGLEIQFNEITSKVGRVTSNLRNTLDVIFPAMFAKERENVQFTLDSYLSSDLSFHKFENVSRDEIKQFLTYIDSNNLQLFYYSLGQINFNQLRDQTNYLHVFYLSLLFENIIKVIARKSSIKELVFSFDDRLEMKQTLDRFFEQEGWRHELSSNWNLTEVVFDSDISEKILNEIANGQFHIKDDWNKIIKMFLISGLARNLSAHEQSKIFSLNRESYLILVNNIVSAIWFTWRYALKKGYISE